MNSHSYNDVYWTGIFKDGPDRYYMIMEDKIKKVVSLLEEFRGGQILDIGCGDGYITDVIGKAVGAEMHGIDIGEAPIRMAVSRGIKVKNMNIDGKRLPYKDNSFDAVFCGDIIEHVFDTEMLLENVHRILRPGGAVVLTTPNIAAWYNRFFLMFGYMPVWIESSTTKYVGNPFMKECPGHIRAFTKRSLRELFEMKNFRIDKIEGCNIKGCKQYSENKERVWNFVDKVFSKVTGLSTTIIVKGRKI
jgi:methionine biosynthesis protein MetW